MFISKHGTNLTLNENKLKVKMFWFDDKDNWVVEEKEVIVNNKTVALVNGKDAISLLTPKGCELIKFIVKEEGVTEDIIKEDLETITKTFNETFKSLN